MPIHAFSTPKPYLVGLQQGELDSLCSVYSVINAARHSAQGIASRPIRPRLLFRHLIRQLEQADLLSEALITGLDQHRILDLLRWTSEWSARHWGVAYTFVRPFGDDETIPAPSVLDCLSFHLTQPNVSVILGVSGDLNHWTCIRAVEHKRLMLLDSSGLRYFSQYIFRRGKRTSDTARYPNPEGLFILHAQRA